MSVLPFLTRFTGPLLGTALASPLAFVLGGTTGASVAESVVSLSLLFAFELLLLLGDFLFRDVALDFALGSGVVSPSGSFTGALLL